MRQRDILQRLLRPGEPARRFCTIESVLPDGRYTVTDDQGRKLTIDGDAGYLPGAQVIIQNGRIVGHGRRTAARKKIRV